MNSLAKKIVLLSLFFVATTFFTGCETWKKKYTNLNVEHQNIKGLFENCKTTLESDTVAKAELAEKLAADQQTIESLRQQIEDRNQAPGQATGFGDDYQVDVDSAAGTITVTLPNTILFSAGKATLKSSANTDLNHIVSVLNQRYASRLIDVIGHTDSDPIKKSSWKDNWQLSTERSLSVLRYLNSNGIPDDRIRAVGCGQGRPIAANTTTAGKSRNRRVEIVVHMR